jgi:2-dehydro-3-deoxy-D-arabinonate dehydratase
MRLIRFATDDISKPRIGLFEDDRVIPLASVSGPERLSQLLHADDPEAEVRRLRHVHIAPLAVDSVRILAPLDMQEVWGAGVTYERSKVARQEESEGAAPSCFSRRRPAGWSARVSRSGSAPIRSGRSPSPSWRWS